MIGFFYCSNKKAWAWTDNPSNNRYHLSLEDIRRLHGSEIIKGDEEKRSNKKYNYGERNEHETR